jgi:hypothetical protein
MCPILQGHVSRHIIDLHPAYTQKYIMPVKQKMYYIAVPI